jgi:hypothetical protein
LLWYRGRRIREDETLEKGACRRRRKKKKKLKKVGKREGRWGLSSRRSGKRNMGEGEFVLICVMMSISSATGLGGFVTMVIPA